MRANAEQGRLIEPISQSALSVLDGACKLLGPTWHISLLTTACLYTPLAGKPAIGGAGLRACASGPVFQVNAAFQLLLLKCCRFLSCCDQVPMKKVLLGTLLGARATTVAAQMELAYGLVQPLSPNDE